RRGGRFVLAPEFRMISLAVTRVRPRARAGFSLIEMMVVLVIAGIVMGIAMPKFSAMFDRLALRAAKQQFQSYVATSRAVAIRQWQTDQLHASGNSIWSNVNQPDGTNANISRSVSLVSARSVTVTTGSSSTASNDSVVYDSRGMSVNLTGSGRKYFLHRNGLK